MSPQAHARVQQVIPREQFQGVAIIGGARGIWLHGDTLVRLLTSLPIRCLAWKWHWLWAVVDKRFLYILDSSHKHFRKANYGSGLLGELRKCLNAVLRLR